MKRETVTIKTPFIKLDSLLKFCGAAETGGHAKELVQSGQVMVNGEICEMRGKKIVAADVIIFNGVSYEVLSGEG